MDSLGKIQLIETHNLNMAICYFAYIIRSTEIARETCYFAYIIRSTEMAMETCFNIPHGQSFETNCKDLIATIKEP